MRPLRALGIYLAAVFVGGALIAPWLYKLAQAFAKTFPNIAEKSFPNFVTSSLMLVAIIGLWPLFRAMGATSLREIGLTNPAEHHRNLLRGIVWGLCSLAIVAAVGLVFGGRAIRPGNALISLTVKLSGAALTAAGVAVLEEILFRGGIFGGLRRSFYWKFALVISSMIYAGCHFLTEVKSEGSVSWLSGLQLLPGMLGGLWNWNQLMPSFVNLTLAGILLGLAYHRTGNLWFSIGMHAGWIFWLAAYRKITQTVPGAANWLWGSNKLIDGWMATIALTLTLIWFLRCQNRTKTTPPK